VKGEEPELQARYPPVINHPQSAAFTFAAPHIGEPKLAQASGVLDQVAGLWSLQQEVLKRQKAVIIKIVRPVALESGQFDEDSLHCGIIRNLRIYAICVDSFPLQGEGWDYGHSPVPLGGDGGLPRLPDGMAREEVWPLS